VTPLDEAIDLLAALIRTPSFSREEAASADLLARWLSERGVDAARKGNNLWARSTGHDASKPSVMLCSHHDTVRPVSSWERDPFDPLVDEERITGLGSNDAGGCLVALCMTFLSLRERTDLPFNLLLVLSAEEEIAGEGGVASVMGEVGPVDLAIVGEPTDMELAVAEKGLMVLDCTAHGVAGHAARSTGVNAITVAMRDIAWLARHEFPEVSPQLGPVKMTVTQISAGTQHNVVPDRCDFVVDVRVTDSISHEEILAVLRGAMESDVHPRSMRLRPSSIADDHPIVQAARELGLVCFGSPTMSDQALLDVPSVKIGPGRSERSHTAGEYITIEELGRGLRLYQELLERYAERLR
jgi:acetylornithine deacetylase